MSLSRRRIAIIACGALAVGVALYARFVRPEWLDPRYDAANYGVRFNLIDGWDAQPKEPYILFIFKNRQTGAKITGAANQVVFKYNPTPELATDEVANRLVEATETNMRKQGWRGVRRADLELSSGRFAVVDRTGPARRIVTAYQVRGNTTLLVSLSAETAKSNLIERHWPDFVRLLDGLVIAPKRM